MDTLKALMVFMTTAENGSFSDAARKLGIAAEIREVDEHTTAEEFFAIVRQVSQDETVDAVLIPRPLPPALNNLDIAPFLNPFPIATTSYLVLLWKDFPLFIALRIAHSN